jgi:hypothetical protein
VKDLWIEWGGSVRRGTVTNESIMYHKGLLLMTHKESLCIDNALVITMKHRSKANRRVKAFFINKSEQDGNVNV